MHKIITPICKNYTQDVLILIETKGMIIRKRDTKQMK